MVDFQSREPRTQTDDEPDDAPEDNAADAEPDDEETEQAATDTEPETGLAYAVVTVTADRSMAEDTQGDAVVELLEDAGETVTTRDLIQPSYDGIQSTLTTLAERRDVDAVITIGGTGVEPDDVTVDAADRLFEKELPGFGELFRRLAADQHGTAVVGTRTTAGIVDDTPAFLLPGTIGGASLATEELVIAEAPGLVTDAAMQDAGVDDS